ncbi:MAG: CinA family protein, partial [Synergistaceae bacterium]|nr:CinA family protein [Synergistaceae bacterium]
MKIKSAVLAAIGDELLSGARLEKNCNFMAKNFHNKGIDLKRVEIISDEESEIINLLSRWIGKVDLLIISGGLGPTHDDKTRYAIAKFLACGLYSADEVYNRVVERVKNDSKRLEYTEKCRDPQAMIPELAAPVFNPTGFALGINFEKDGTRVLALPGVPMEYESMTRQEFPEIFSQNSDENYAWKSVIILDVPEMKIAEKIPEVIGDKNLHVSILPAFPQVELIIRGEPSRVENSEKIIREKFPDALPENCSSIAEAVLFEAGVRNAKISCAESCTGGLVGATLTEIPGSSEFFNGSAVTYSNEAKIKILGVTENTLKN